MTQASIKISREPSVQYLLRLGDTCLIHAQRTAEWCGHAPLPEEDIALSNMALDLVGQARAVLTRAGQLEAELGEGSWITERALATDVFTDDPDALWADVLRRKGPEYRLMSTMPFDPDLN